MGRCVVIGLLTWAMIGVGCRQNESVVEPVADRVAESVDVPVAAARAELSAEQKAAIERMQAAGAGVERDGAGFPVRIDLASERVFADEDLVRAALLFANLKSLRLAVSSVPQATLAKLALLADLEELFLQDAAIDDAGLGTLLVAMPRLERLSLRRLNDVTDDALSAVARCKSIEVVALIEMNQVTGVGLARLAGLPRLRSLDLRSCGRLAVEDFQCLAEFKTLVELKLGGPAVNNEIATVLLNLPHLRSLTIEDAEISAAFLDKLSSDKAAAERLQTLAFARCFGITDEALTSIDRLPNLETLSVRDMMVSGQFLTTLSEAGSGPLALKSLTAVNAFLDDAAIGHLPTIAPRLERLDLRGNPGITDASEPTLEKLRNLKDVKLE
ncbi:MAG: hypothetical protein U1E05_12890 [Patescibacteria group bacterium]|nr:hypothetical protein [Patescibacteria group bacterium]